MIPFASAPEPAECAPEGRAARRARVRRPPRAYIAPRMCVSLQAVFRVAGNLPLPFPAKGKAMYPIHDIDALLLLATALAAKRRPAELVEIIAAADLLEGDIVSDVRLVETFHRFATHGLIVGVDGRYALTAAAEALAAGLPKKADGAARIALVREKLTAYNPDEKHPSLAITVEEVGEALRAHRAAGQTGVRNLLMPKPKPTPEEEARRRPGGRSFGPRRRG